MKIEDQKQSSPELSLFTRPRVEYLAEKYQRFAQAFTQRLDSLSQQIKYWEASWDQTAVDLTGPEDGKKVIRATPGGLQGELLAELKDIFARHNGL